MREVTKRELLYHLEKMNNGLNGITRKVCVYCVGGSALTLIDHKYITKDIDLALSERDFITISGTISEIEQREKIRIDLFRDFALVEYSLPNDFTHRSNYVASFKNLNIYRSSNLDLVLMKALAGRERDKLDVEKLIKKVPKDELLNRFEDLRFKDGFKESLKEKLDEFIGVMYN